MSFTFQYHDFNLIVHKLHSGQTVLNLTPYELRVRNKQLPGEDDIVPPQEFTLVQFVNDIPYVTMSSDEDDVIGGVPICYNTVTSAWDNFFSGTLTYHADHIIVTDKIFNILAEIVSINENGPYEFVSIAGAEVGLTNNGVPIFEVSAFFMKH